MSLKQKVLCGGLAPSRPHQYTDFVLFITEVDLKLSKILEFPPFCKCLCKVIQTSKNRFVGIENYLQALGKTLVQFWGV